MPRWARCPPMVGGRHPRVGALRWRTRPRPSDRRLPDRRLPHRRTSGRWLPGRRTSGPRRSVVRALERRRGPRRSVVRTRQERRWPVLRRRGWRWLVARRRPRWVLPAWGRFRRTVRTRGPTRRVVRRWHQSGVLTWGWLPALVWSPARTRPVVRRRGSPAVEGSNRTGIRVAAQPPAASRPPDAAGPQTWSRRRRGSGGRRAAGRRGWASPGPTAVADRPARRWVDSRVPPRGSSERGLRTGVAGRRRRDAGDPPGVGPAAGGLPGVDRAPVAAAVPGVGGRPGAGPARGVGGRPGADPARGVGGPRDAGPARGVRMSPARAPDPCRAPGGSGCRGGAAWGERTGSGPGSGCCAGRGRVGCRRRAGGRLAVPVPGRAIPARRDGGAPRGRTGHRGAGRRAAGPASVRRAHRESWGTDRAAPPDRVRGRALPGAIARPPVRSTLRAIVPGAPGDAGCPRPRARVTVAAGRGPGRSAACRRGRRTGTCRDPARGGRAPGRSADRGRRGAGNPRRVAGPGAGCRTGRGRPG
jgi:hypothetical protein